MSKENIKYLMEEIRTLEQSEQNKQRKEKWKGLHRTAREQWRGVPKMDYSWKSGTVPISIGLQNNFWNKYFKFSIKDYYCNPEVFIENYLRIAIEHFKLFDDDTFITKQIPIWGGTVYEGSLFGLKAHYYDDSDPWLENRIIINEESDLAKVEMPDFKTSGLMPQTIKFYEAAQELVDDDFDILFPEWIRSTFGVAVYLRGYENLLLDTLRAPDFAKELFGFVTEARKKWYTELSEYLGEPIKKGDLFNDEVNCPSLSPGIYRDLVLPYEQDLCRFHNGILYWHSCGDVTKLLDGIAEIGPIEMMHVGPWTDIEKAAEVFKDKAPLEICMDPVKDVLNTNENQLRLKLQTTIDALKRQNVAGFTFRLSPIEITKSIDYTLEKVKMWKNVTEEVIQSI